MTAWYFKSFEIAAKKAIEWLWIGHFDAFAQTFPDFPCMLSRASKLEIINIDKQTSLIFFMPIAARPIFNFDETICEHVFLTEFLPISASINMSIQSQNQRNNRILELRMPPFWPSMLRNTDIGFSALVTATTKKLLCICRFSIRSSALITNLEAEGIYKQGGFKRSWCTAEVLELSPLEILILDVVTKKDMTTLVLFQRITIFELRALLVT
ncbi:MAG: hypothetical protein CMJ52_05395 [Planctomycetaceae bacterium]|nr:hypothetical protein [Planctomycetaceae bacterium]